MKWCLIVALFVAALGPSGFATIIPDCQEDGQYPGLMGQFVEEVPALEIIVAATQEDVLIATATTSEQAQLPAAQIVTAIDRWCDMGAIGTGTVDHFLATAGEPPTKETGSGALSAGTSTQVILTLGHRRTAPSASRIVIRA